MRWRRTIVLVLGLAVAGGTLTVYAAGDEGALDALIRSYMADRDAEAQIAPDHQLCRRAAVDLTGAIPTAEDLAACEGLSPVEMIDYFMSSAPRPYTAGESPYAWVNVLRDGDFFLFSNSTQFSQVAHIREFRQQLLRIYVEGWSYQEFARWALQSQMFVNRFPSGADRANAAFFLFLGRDSFSSEVPFGDMWNGYGLRDPNIPANQAENDPDYHVYDFDETRCTSGQIMCTATLWGTVGSTPQEAAELVVTSPMFAEAVVDRYWQRFIGRALPGEDYPEIRALLAHGLIANNYNVNWLIRELTSSVVYSQEMLFR